FCLPSSTLYRIAIARCSTSSSVSSARSAAPPIARGADERPFLRPSWSDARARLVSRGECRRDAARHRRCRTRDATGARHRMQVPERTWFDTLTTSAHPEPVEGCVLGDLRGETVRGSGFGALRAASVLALAAAVTGRRVDRVCRCRVPAVLLE